MPTYNIYSPGGDGIGEGIGEGEALARLVTVQDFRDIVSEFAQGVLDIDLGKATGGFVYGTRKDIKEQTYNLSINSIEDA